MSFIYLKIDSVVLVSYSIDYFYHVLLFMHIVKHFVTLSVKSAV